MTKSNLIDTSCDGAVLSLCTRYRYSLTRMLKGFDDPFVVCMLNPSTADATQNDPTIRRCIGFAERENAHSLIVVNLFAWRSTDPLKMPHDYDECVGPENDDVLLYVAQHTGNRIVCAWGAGSPYPRRAREVCTMFRDNGVNLVCLAETKKGHPGHPLYIPAVAPLMPYRGAAQ